MASTFFRSAFRKVGSVPLMKMNPAGLAMWVFPAAVGATWFIWPALDREWLIELGLAKEPDLHIKAVQDAKDARMAAKKKAAPAAEEEEEEEEEEEAAADEGADEAEEAGGDDEEGGEEEAGEEEEDEEEEEEESAFPKFPPLVAKATGGSLQESWDNFTLKSIRPGEDDDEEEEEEDEDEE